MKIECIQDLFFLNNKEHESNDDICFLIDKVSKEYEDLTSFTIGNDMYELAKQKNKRLVCKMTINKKSIQIFFVMKCFKKGLNT